MTTQTQTHRYRPGIASAKCQHRVDSWSSCLKAKDDPTHTTHVHDLAVTISAGDVPAERMADLAQRLLEAAEKVCEAFNATGDDMLYANISYDGRRECDLSHER